MSLGLGAVVDWGRQGAVQDAEAASPGKARGLSLAPTHFPARLPWDDEQQLSGSAAVVQSSAS